MASYEKKKAGLQEKKSRERFFLFFPANIAARRRKKKPFPGFEKALLSASENLSLTLPQTRRETPKKPLSPFPENK